MAGRFVWYELMTTGREAAIAFYGAVVGWTASEFADAPGGGYSILAAGARAVGGVLQLEGECAGMRPGWVGYIAVDDADAAAGSVAGAGGRILMPAGDIPGVGRFAMVADPGGAPFYLLAPDPRDDAPPPAETKTVGTIGWHELYSSVGEEAAFAFYARQFGWETIELMDMGPMGKYRIFGRDGQAMGGMIDKPANIPGSVWSFYVHVDGIDAAAERVGAGGGEVTMGPHQVPDGSWIIQARDPQGSSFALVSTTR